MGSVSDFLKSQQFHGPKHGGGKNFERVDFYNKGKGKSTHAFRLIEWKEGEFCYQFPMHKPGRDFKNWSVCQKFFGPDTYCELCEKTSMLFAEEEEKAARDLSARKSTWLYVIPMNSDREHVHHILEIPHGAMQKLMLAITLQGSWNDPEPDWENPDFVASFKEGLAQVIGEKAKDLILDFDPNGKANAYKWKFSPRVGKKVELPEKGHDLDGMFRAIKKLKAGTDTGPRKTEAKAEETWDEKKFQSMRKSQLFNWCVKQKPKIEVNTKMKKSEIIDKIKERFNG